MPWGFVHEFAHGHLSQGHNIKDERIEAAVLLLDDKLHQYYATLGLLEDYL